MSSLPFLLVAVPLLGALVPFVLADRHPVLARRATAAVLLFQVGLALAAAVAVATTGPLSLVVGGLPAAVGIGLLVDQLSVAFALFVALAGAVVYLLRVEPTGPGDALWLLLVAGLTGMTVTADVFNLYVFLEIAGLAAYALVATRAGGPAALAALRYLLAGTVGATFYLLGVGYLYVATGTLAMADLAPALAAVGHDSPTVVAAFVLVVVGLGTKVALFPVHAWKPDAYASAPADVAALLAAVGSTVPGYALVRVVFDVFTVDFLVAVPAARALLVGGGLVSVLAGGYLTLRQSEGRRLLAYSSVLQFGLVVVGLGVATTAAVTAAVLLLLANGVAKAGLFVAAGRLEAAAGPAVGDWAGLARDRPVLGVAVAVAFASLVGLPPTVGFAGKWYLALAAVDASRPVAAAVVLASTLVSLAYAGRVVEHLYFGTATADGTRAATDGGRPVEDEEPVGDPGDDAVRGGRHPAGTGRALDRRATAVVALAAAGTLALGLGSTAVADWVAPVVGAWLEGSA